MSPALVKQIKLPRWIYMNLLRIVTEEERRGTVV
mgnify:CR=1 FL=1